MDCGSAALESGRAAVWDGKQGFKEQMRRAAAPSQFGKRLTNQVFEALFRTGTLEMLLRADRDWLTVLNYHRIDDPFRPGFDTYTPNVSATPAAFRRQAEYLKSHYNVITCKYLAQWLRGQCDLPPRPAIITFDDGYCDNLEHAYPILRELGLPATIFLVTGIIGSDMAFPWDRAAYCFYHTLKEEAVLPVTGRASWSGQTGREVAMREWFTSIKDATDAQRGEMVEALAQALDVEIPPKAFSGLYLNWDQVRELSRNGIEMGAHTASHPILTRESLERVQREIVDSKVRIEAEIGKPVVSFAYPNGGPSDFSPDIMAILRAAGIEIAFSLVPGPTRKSTVRKNPLGIRRIYVGLSDTMPRFAAKLAGMSRVAGY